MKHKAIKYSCHGNFIHLANTRVFIYEKDSEETIQCFYSIPISSYFYRKLINNLSTKSLSIISFDVSGLGNSLSVTTLNTSLINFSK